MNDPQQNKLPPLTPIRVLIIEDSESDTALVIRQLEKAGYTVAHQRVENADQLKEALKNQDWDIVIADYRLPEFDAPAALAVFQNTGLDIPFIVVSGAIGEETAVSLMKSGACDYLMKNNLARLAPVVKRELSEVEVRLGRKRAHEALLESERNLQNSQRIAHVGHWIMKPQSGEVVWSDELFRIFGLNPANFHGNLNEVWQKAIHPDDSERVLVASDINDESKHLKQIEYRIVRPDGTFRNVLSLAGETKKDEKGQSLQFSGVLQDITEQKQAELALLQEMEASQQRARELETITAVSSSMRQAQTRFELVDLVLLNLVTLLQAQFGTLGFMEGNSLLFEYAVGNIYPWQKQHVPIATPFLGEVIRTGKSLTLDSRDSDLTSTLPDWILGNLPPLGAMMVYPLISGHNTVGTIVLGFNHPGYLSSAQNNLVAAVAEMAGNAINRMLAAEELENMVYRREKELELIYQVTSAASKSLDIRQALQEALALALGAIHADVGGIYLLNEPDSQPGWIVYQGIGLENPDIFEQTFPMRFVNTVIANQQTVLEQELEPDQRQDSASNQIGIDSLIGLPMRIQDRVIGVLVTRKPGGEKVIMEELTLLSFIADHLGLIVENSRLYKKAEQSAILGERSRLARELHDSVTQLLYSANLYSVGAQRYASQGVYQEVNTYLTIIGNLIQQALKDMRLLVYELRPSELVQNGLLGALQNRLDSIERRSAIQVVLRASGISPLPERIEENLYRIAIEALNNSLKHAQASHLWIELNQTDKLFTLVIQDDGSGFDPASTVGQGGIGLASMRERTEIISGSVQVQSSPGKGTRIEVHIPLALA
jgi:PAS domain S-box-containing protein